MSHSPDQLRQKAEAMREAAHHVEHSTVDGSPKRSSFPSHMAHMMDQQSAKSVKEELC